MLFRSTLHFFLTWWGAYLLGVLDATMLFFLPFGVDALVIYLAARNAALAWVYPILATAGSLTGTAITFWIGQKLGEMGLERFVPAARLERFRARVQKQGAIAMAAAALMPPPFPLTPFVLTCGALQVDRWRFFGTFAVVRLIRFGAEALLARMYGRGVLRVLESDSFQRVIIGFVVVAIAGTAISGVLLWRSTRRPRLSPA